MATQTVETDDLDFELEIDEVEYSRIMRRIGIDGDETVTHVSAFNSSI
jgi:hypothetical protein